MLQHSNQPPLKPTTCLGNRTRVIEWWPFSWVGIFPPTNLLAHPVDASRNLKGPQPLGMYHSCIAVKPPVTPWWFLQPPLSLNWWVVIRRFAGVLGCHQQSQNSIDPSSQNSKIDHEARLGSAKTSGGINSPNSCQWTASGWWQDGMDQPAVYTPPEKT